ncbi:hypothetical protein F5Y07DRAFT_366120 [Xylaria sp. FL0933]|nr:hypothetical protein F5Y07DRAFT_366120 [Xylaria sp. FL0933]
MWIYFLRCGAAMAPLLLHMRHCVSLLSSENTTVIRYTTMITWQRVVLPYLFIGFISVFVPACVEYCAGQQAIIIHITHIKTVCQWPHSR